jgi:3,2-trans-enoyl-CoA isomerase
MQTISTIIEGDIATIRLQRGKANAINQLLISELTQAILELKANEQVRGVLLTGRGEFFSAGLDLIEIYEYNEIKVLDFWRDFDRLLRLMVAFPKPLVNAITGHCEAGGTLFSLCADFRVMAEGPYRIGLNEVEIGIVIPETIYHLYSFVLGRNKAYQYLLDGKMHSPQEALSNGLVQAVVPLAEVEQVALEKLKAYLKFSTRVWAQSKLNFRNALLMRIRTDFQTSFEPTFKQWWTEESRTHFRHLAERLKGGKQG